MLVCEFPVSGLPTPQGSKSAWVNPKTGRAVIIDGGSTASQKAHKAWRAAVDRTAREWIAANEPWLPLDEPVKIGLRFMLPPVASAPHRVMHATKPDVDKLVRSVLDSLTTSGLLRDDSRVSHVEAIKEYAGPDDPTGCLVRVFALGAVEQTLADARRRSHRSTTAVR